MFPNLDLWILISRGTEGLRDAQTSTQYGFSRSRVQRKHDYNVLGHFWLEVAQGPKLVARWLNQEPPFSRPASRPDIPMETKQAPKANVARNPGFLDAELLFTLE